MLPEQLENMTIMRRRWDPGSAELLVLGKLSRPRGCRRRRPTYRAGRNISRGGRDDRTMTSTTTSRIAAQLAAQVRPVSPIGVHVLRGLHRPDAGLIVVTPSAIGWRPWRFALALF